MKDRIEEVKRNLSSLWQDLNQDMEDLKKEGWSDEEWAEYKKVMGKMHYPYL